MGKKVQKVKCSCGQTHDNHGERLKCLTARGLMNKKGKLKNMIMENNNGVSSGPQADQCISNTVLLQSGSLIFQKQAQEANILQKGIVQLGQTVEIISNFINLRHGLKNKQDVSCQVLKNRNFSHLMKKKDQPELNILEQIVEEERLFDEKYYPKKIKQQSIRDKEFVDVIQREDRDEFSNSDLEIIENKEEKEHVLNQQYQIISQRQRIKKANHIQQRKDNIQKVMEEVFIDSSVLTELKLRKLPISQLPSLKRKLGPKCRFQLENYKQKCKNFGKFHKFDARLQPVETLLQKLEWEKYRYKEEKQKEIYQILQLSAEQKQQYWEKQNIFKMFKKAAFKRQIQELLYAYQKIIHRDSNGKIISIQKTKIGRINSLENQYLVKQFNQKIQQRFQRLCYYTRLGIIFVDTVRQDFQNYPTIFQQISHFYTQQNNRNRLKQKIKKEEQQKEIAEMEQSFKKQAKLQIINVSVIHPLVKDMVLWKNKQIIVTSQKDLDYLLLCILFRQQCLITKEIQSSSISCKLAMLKPCQIALIPHDFAFRSSDTSKRQNYYFLNSQEVRIIIKKYLLQIIVNASFEKDKVTIKGFILRTKPSQHKGKSVKYGFSNKGSACQFFVQNNRKAQKKAQEKSLTKANQLILHTKHPNYNNQNQILNNFEKWHKIMATIDCTLDLCYWRKKKQLSTDHLFFHNFGNSFSIIKFINAFPNFYNFYSGCIIQCSKFNLSNRKRAYYSQIQNTVKKIKQIQKKQQSIIETASILSENETYNEFKFNQVEYTFSDKALKLKEDLQKNRISANNKQKILKKLNPEKQECYQIINLLKQCSICRKQFQKQDKKRLKCRFCYNEMHFECSKLITNCLCENIELELKKQNTLPSFLQEYCALQVGKHSNLSRNKFQGIQTFKSKNSISNIQNKQKQIIQALSGRQLLYYKTALIHRSLSNDVLIDRYYDPLITNADKKLTEQWKKYENGQYKAPVQLKVRDKDFFGIQALELIPKLTLICQYAGDIVPMVYASKLKWKGHIMLYSQGRVSDQELVVVPFNFCNWGCLINHSQSANCSYLRVVIENTVRVLIYSTKDIQAQNELLINYNGYHDEYPVEDFQEF